MIHSDKFLFKSAGGKQRNEEKRVFLRIVNFDFATLLLGIGRFGPQIRILREISVPEPESETCTAETSREIMKTV